MNHHHFQNDIETGSEPAINAVVKVVSCIVGTLTGLYTYFKKWNFSKWMQEDPMKQPAINIELPVHNIHYMPELHEIIPSLVVACCSCLCVFMLNKLLNYAWDKIKSPIK